MADVEPQQQETSLISQETNNTKPTEKGFEAEDIVADAIKLNVDEDLNEQRYDNSSEKSSNFQNGNSLDNANIEDEPNYEIDENDEEQYLKEQDCQEKNGGDENKERHDCATSKEGETAETKGKEIQSDNAGDNDAQGQVDEKGAKGVGDKKHDSKSSESKTNNAAAATTTTNTTTKDDQSKKESVKKETSTNETDSKASKSKSSTSKDKDKEKSSDHKNTKLSGSKLFGVITMETIEQAEKCIQNLNKTEFDGKTITVEKSRLDGKKLESKDESKDRDKKDGEKSSIKRDRSRSPKRRSSHSPIRRFPLHNRPSFPSRRGPPPFSFRGGRGSFAPIVHRRPPYIPSGPPPMMMRKFEVERMMERREFRAKEFRDRERSRREEEDYRRQKDLERRQQEEREKLEREKLKLKIERERLEREKAEFLRAERDKARIERERLEREREELRRKALAPVSSSRLDDRGSKRAYDDLYGSSTWESDRKRGSSFLTASSTAPLTSSSRYPDLEPGLGGNSFTNFTSYLIGSNADLVDRRKLDVGMSASSSNLRDSNRSSSGYDRDDRRPPTNGSGLGYSSASRSSLSSRDRDTRRDRDDWKSVDSRRTDSRSFLDSKGPLAPPTAPSQSSYLFSATTGGSAYDRAPDAWSTAPDRMPPARTLGKFSSYTPVSAIADRSRVAPSLSQSVMGSTIGLYNNPAPMSGMSGLISNPSYNSSLNSANHNSGHRRY